MRDNTIHSVSLKYRRAMTLIEVMVAVAVVVIAALGTLCYEYLCVDQVQFARAQLTATRIGQLLLEDWKSQGGSENYDPEELQMGFSLPSELPDGTYMTVVNDLPLYIYMAQNDVVADEDAGVTLRKIAVVVRWNKDSSAGIPTEEDPHVTLTTYVRRDQ